MSNRILNKVVLTVMFIAFTSVVASNANATEPEDEIAGMMTTARVSGFCGAVRSMVAFQNAEQIPGGSDFLALFYVDYSEKMGMTTTEMIETCNHSIEVYESYRKLLELP